MPTLLDGHDGKQSTITKMTSGETCKPAGSCMSPNLTRIDRALKTLVLGYNNLDKRRSPSDARIQTGRRRWKHQVKGKKSKYLTNLGLEHCGGS